MFFFFQAEDGIRDVAVTGVQTCALPISPGTTAQSGGISTRARAGGSDSPATSGAELHAHVAACGNWLARGRSHRVVLGRYQSESQESHGSARYLARTGEFAQVCGQISRRTVRFLRFRLIS